MRLGRGAAGADPAVDVGGVVRCLNCSREMLVGTPEHLFWTVYGFACEPCIERMMRKARDRTLAKGALPGDCFVCAMNHQSIISMGTGMPACSECSASMCVIFPGSKCADCTRLAAQYAGIRIKRLGGWFTKVYPKIDGVRKCDCGSAAVSSPNHSDWCSLTERRAS